MTRSKLWSWFGPLLAAALLAAPGVTQPPPPCVIGGTPGIVISGYNVTTSANSLTSILGNPATIPIFILPPIDDPTSPTIGLPFAFPSWTVIQNGLQVNNNGWMAFDQNLGTGFFDNQPIPSSPAPNHALFPWWNDLILPTGSPGSVAYLVAGTTPNQTLTVEWDQEESWFGNGAGNGDPGTFQVVLHEGTGVVDFHYDPAGILGASQHDASVGYENASGGTGGDLTGLLNLNTLFPSTDFTLTPSGLVPTGASPVPSYTVTVLPPAYASITGSPGEIVTWVGNAATGLECGACGVQTDDDNTLALPMPFPFDYFLTAATTFSVDSNGYLYLNGGGCGGYISQTPGTPGAAGTAAPFWDDLQHRAANARTSRLVTGPPGNQQMVVQWENLSPWFNNVAGNGNCEDPGNRISFQVVLNEGSNTIEFRYGGEVPGLVAGYGAAVGITDETGAYGTDATGLGTANMTLPISNYLLDPCEPCGDLFTFGPGCGPVIGQNSPAIPGNLAYALTESGAPPGSFALLYLGFSNTTAFGFIPLPLAIGTFGFLGGCSLVIDPALFIGVTVVGGGGGASLGIPLAPGTPSCAGPIYAQWFNVVPPGTVIASNGAGIVTG